MLITSEKTKNLDEFMDNLNRDNTNRKKIDFRILKLREEIKRLSKYRMSIQRSGNSQRIGKFNKLFIAKISELSKLYQTTGKSNRDEIARMVREAKAK